MYSLAGEYGTVEAVEVVEDPQPMYNLTVEDAHTFAVGDGAWVVHNQDFLTNDQGLIVGYRGGSGRIPASGIQLPRPITPDELVNLWLDDGRGIELGLGREINLANGIGGQWYIYSGHVNVAGNNVVTIPLRSPRGIPQQSIVHIHPSGNQIPSASDLSDINLRASIRIPTVNGQTVPLQQRAFIFPLEYTNDGVQGRSIPYYPNTTVDDYFSGGKHGQYYNDGGVSYLAGC